MTAKQRVKVAIAGYLVALTFAAVFLVAQWKTSTQSQSIALGIAAALPLAIAFVGDKIQSFKGFGFEVETKSAAASVAEISTLGSESLEDLAGVSTSEVLASGVGAADSGVDATDTAVGAIPAQVAVMIASPKAEVVELDLHDGNYWWPTRLYLLAALLTDYTHVKRLAFIQTSNTGVQQAKYAGMAEPCAVNRRVELAIPGLAAAYQMSRSQALAAVVDDPIPPNDAIDRPASVRGQLSTSDRTRLVEATAANWPHAVRANGISEGGPAPRVNRGWLETTLGNDWRWAAIDVEGDPDSPLLQYQVVTSADEYTALLADGVLTRVIGQQRLARSIAKSYLEKRLGS